MTKPPLTRRLVQNHLRREPDRRLDDAAAGLDGPWAGSQELSQLRQIGEIVAFPA